MIAALTALAAFTLAGPGVSGQIWVGADEPAYVRKAAEDLIADTAKITGAGGGRGAPRLTFAASFETCVSPCVVLASVSVASSASHVPAATVEKLRGKWEAYEVAADDTAGRQRLIVAGSDPRGTIFGLYAFIEQRLGVDPLYFWTGREPAPRAVLSWPMASLNISAGEPTVKYRGWFINDEDLLTEWKDGGGRRELDYPYYSQVVAADVADRVFEAMVRLQMNVVIPASFIDILNPAEAALVERARARGLYLSMHHVEPMGVSGFTFQNYWKARGKSPKFSFYSSRAELEEAWRVYAAAWAKQPDVIWQIGLRGIADRPMWMADPSIPQSDAERGRLISEAMAVQMRIIAEVDRRPRPPVTTTLWAEGAFMQAEGHLKIPAGVTVVFSDNSPGWKLQRDFFEAPREAGREYGIYYHHQLWSSGPHLVQAVPPAKTHEIVSLAVAKNAGSYAILNVGNVREFAMGLDASARMLRDLRGFAPDAYVASWCEERFGGAAAGAHACAAYRALFGSYAISPETGTPMLMDGQTISAGLRTLDRLARRRAGTAGPAEIAGTAGTAGTVGTAGTAAPPQTAEQKASAEWGARALSDTNPAARLDDASLLKAAVAQCVKLDEAVKLGEQARAAIAAASDDAGAAREFFEANFLAQAGMHRGLTAWLEQVLTASLAEARGDRAAATVALHAGRTALRGMRESQRLAMRGRFADWYRGDKKMRLSRAEEATDKALAALAKERSAHDEGEVREALARENVNPSPRGERDREVGRLFTLSYASTIDPLPDLRARVVVPPGTARVPIIVLMHGFTLDASSFDDDTYQRFASAGSGAIVIGVDMRGRGGSSGKPDAGGREIHDIVDAIDAVTARYSERVLPDAVHLIGYSGGGANVLSAAGRFPDRFASVNAFFPIADYGFDRALGWWWQCSTRQRDKLIEWIGNRDAATATVAAVDAYASRAPIFALSNFRGAPLRLFHDRGDTNVPPSHTLALRGAAVRAGMTNVDTFISEPTDAVRWLHAAPNGDAPVRHAEPRMLADITPDSRIASPLPRRGRLAIAGYVVTRDLSVWLGDGTSARGWIEYDLDTRTFDITYDTLAASASASASAPTTATSPASDTGRDGRSGDESRAPWTLTLFKRRPGEHVSLTINRQPFSGTADETGAVRIMRARH